MTKVESKPTKIDDIPGWFFPLDRKVFEYFLEATTDVIEGDQPSTVVELGAYLGKSAAFIGERLTPTDRFVVNDMFDSSYSGMLDASYKGLTREAFERNYRAVCGNLPEIVQGPSKAIREHVGRGSVRFMHVDASHFYDDVVLDVLSARDLMAPGGVVVFDDYRTDHSPGVGAAVWGAVERGDLEPVAVTPMKLYATFGHGLTARTRLTEWLREQNTLQWETQPIAGVDLVRLKQPPRRAEKADKRVADAEKRNQQLEAELAAVKKQLAREEKCTVYDRVREISPLERPDHAAAACTTRELLAALKCRLTYKIRTGKSHPRKRIPRPNHNQA